MSLKTTQLNIGGSGIKKVSWNGKLFTISNEKILSLDGRLIGKGEDVVHLTPKEMLILIKFAGSLGGAFEG